MAASMIGVALKHIFRKKWRSIFFAVSISLSVGLLSAVLVLNEQMNEGLEELRASTFGEADLWMGTREHHDKGDSFGIDSETVAKIKNSSYVSRLGKIIDGSRYSIQINETNLRLGRFIIGVDNSELTKSYYKYSRDLDENEVALSSSLAEQLHLQENDKISISTADGRMTEWIVSDILGQSGFREDSGYIALFHLESLQRMIGAEGRVSSVLIQLQSDVNIDAVEPLLRKEMGLGSEYFFQTIDTDSRERLNVVAVQVVMFVLMFFAILAAIVVLVSVLQTSFRERSMEFATIRSIGGSVKQLFTLLVFEVGMIALFGVAFGVVSGTVITRSGSPIAAAVMNLELARTSAPIGQLLFMSIAMLLIIIAASLLPMIKAAATDPMACFKNVYEEGANDKPSYVLLFCIVAGSFLILGITRLLVEGTGFRFILSLFGGGLLCISALMCLHHFFRPCVSLLTPLLSRIFGNDTRVAITYISISKSRTTLTLFLISISLIVFIPMSCLTALSKKENEASLDRIYAQDTDMIIENRHTGFYNPTLPFSLIEELESFEQVESVIPVLPVIIANLSGDTFRKYEPISVYPTDLKKMVDERAVSEFSTDLSRTAILSKSYSEHLGVKTGDYIKISHRNLTEEIVVGSIVEQLPYFISDDRVMLVHISHPIVTKTDVVDKYFIRVSDPNNGFVISNIKLLQKRYPELTWREKERELEQLNEKTKQIMGVLWVTVYVIISTGLVGLFNLLSATIHEKKVEYGILRAIHFTPGQIIKNIMLQSAIYAIVAVGIGAVMGTIIIVTFFNGLGENHSVVGLPVQKLVPIDDIGFMAVSLIALTLLFSIPMAIRLAKMKIVKLLSPE